MTLALHGWPDWQTSLNTADLRASTNSTAINGGGVLTLSTLDMRLYSSFDLRINATVNPTPPTAFNPIEVQITWYEDAALTTAVWEDSYVIFAGKVTGGVFDVSGGRLYVQDVVHGPYLSVFLRNSGVDQVQAVTTVYGHTRSIPGYYIRESDATVTAAPILTGTVVLNDVTVIGVGLNINRPCRLNPGPAYIIAAAVAAPVTITIFGADGSTLDTFGGIAGLRQEIYLPRMSTRVNVANAGGVPATATTRILRSMAGTWS